MKIARRRVASLQRRRPSSSCHPLTRRGDADLDSALLALHASKEMKEFWEATRRVIHAALPLHFICMCLRPFAMLPSTIFRERAPFASEEDFRIFQETYPLQAALSSQPGVKLSRLSDAVTNRDLLQSEFYRRFMLPHQDRYFGCLNFWAGGIFQGMIGLHRTSADHDFTDAELATLLQLHPHFDTVLQRILALHRERAVRLSLEKLLVNLPIATILLDWDLRVVCRNRMAVQLCAVWELGPARASREKLDRDFHLPLSVVRYCGDFKARWNPSHHRTCTLMSENGEYIEHPNFLGIRASVNLLQLDAAPLSMPMFLVRIEHNETNPSAKLPVTENATGPLTRLSSCERDVALLVGRGLSNDEVAGELGKSVMTVKKQLRAIYQKLDVPGRCRLIALIR